MEDSGLFTDDFSPAGAENGAVKRHESAGEGRALVDPLEQRVRSLYAALARRDLGEIAAQLAHRVVWEDARFHPSGQTYRGRVQVVDHLARLIGQTGGSYELTVLDLFASSAGRFVVREREIGWRHGRRLDHEVCLRVDVSPDGITYLERFDADLADASRFFS
jgi:ketosteroid isomerase-like protein